MMSDKERNQAEDETAKMQEEEKRKKKKAKKKYIYIDDGRTVADMNVEGMPGYDKLKNEKKKDPERLTFKEKMAVLFGAYRAYFPYLVIMILALSIVYLLIYIIWGS